MKKRSGTELMIIGAIVLVLGVFVYKTFFAGSTNANILHNLKHGYDELAQ